MAADVFVRVEGGGGGGGGAAAIVNISSTVGSRGNHQSSYYSRACKNLDALSCIVRPKAGCHSVQRQMINTPGMDQRKTGTITVGYHPLCVYYPLST